MAVGSLETEYLVGMEELAEDTTMGDTEIYASIDPTGTLEA